MKTPDRTARKGNVRRVTYQRLELKGARYAVVDERLLRRVCALAGIEASCAESASAPEPLSDEAMETYDGALLAQRIAERRKAAGLTQAQLAGQAGIRIETLNRIERGRTTPDFATIRKLVTAIQQAEAQ